MLLRARRYESKQKGTLWRPHFYGVFKKPIKNIFGEHMYLTNLKSNRIIPFKHLGTQQPFGLGLGPKLHVLTGLSWAIWQLWRSQGGSRAFDSRASRPFKITTGTQQGGKRQHIQICHAMAMQQIEFMPGPWEWHRLLQHIGRGHSGDRFEKPKEERVL